MQSLQKADVLPGMHDTFKMKKGNLEQLPAFKNHEQDVDGDDEDAENNSNDRDEDVQSNDEETEYEQDVLDNNNLQ